MFATLTSETTFKISSLLGSILIGLTLYFSWSQISDIEQQVSIILEQRILSQLDVESLQSQYLSLQQAINQQDPSQTEDTYYSDEQIKILNAEAKTIYTQIDDLIIQLSDLDHAKLAIVHKAKVIFFAATILNATGIVLTILGAIGWYFHVQTMADRRMEPRNAAN